MSATGQPTLRLTLARACAWSLLLAGWIGLGSLAMQFAASWAGGFALIALWLLALGGAASVATRGAFGPARRALALVGGALCTAGALWSSVRGGGQAAVLAAVLGWATLTALASGVVRGLRLTEAMAPRPPITAASLGALAAAVVLGDAGDLPALALRLSLWVCAVAALLIVLQWRLQVRSQAPGCRAGLFDCSLPAWPAGAWRDPQLWPVLLAGLAMLPMMAALPLVADWCRALALPPSWMVSLHLAAMFGPALLLQPVLVKLSVRTLATACTMLLLVGAVCVLAAPAPWSWAGLALSHGAAWGLAWAGQLWAPARRGQQGTSPMRAAAGYALLTVAFGLAVERYGAAGVTMAHASLGAAALLSWGLRWWSAAGDARIS